MNLNVLYLRCQFWLKDYLKGSPIRKAYNEIKYLSEHSLDEGKEIRATQLSKMLRHAQKNTNFYKNYSSLDLYNYPVVNKSILLDNYEDIKVNEDSIPGQIGSVHIQSTSGSTGIPFKISQDTRKRQRRIAELKYFGQVVGFGTHERLIHLRTWNRWQMKTPKQIKAENIIPFDISDLGTEKLAELCKLINSEKALCLRGYASSFDLLSDYCLNNSMEFPSLEIIIAGSEALDDKVRKRVKENMKCEIISQYANEECGILAQERVPTEDTDNVMYLNHASYFFELLKMDSDEHAEYGELGRFVITDLYNYAFPIIRYDTGDCGMLLPPNEYSKGYPILGKLYGRRLDICYTTKGTPFLPMTIGRILKHYECISQWQFIQQDEKKYTLKLKLSNTNNVQLENIVSDVKENIGVDADLNIEVIEEIPILASGKRKSVVNNWKKI